MRLAASLGNLLDQLYNADATAEQLRDLLPDQFSAHWQDILILLRILSDRWPEILSQENLLMWLTDAIGCYAASPSMAKNPLIN